MRNIVLASSSPRRREILSRAGVKFVVDPGDYEEDMTLKLKPVELAKVLSRGKAESVIKRHRDAVIIGADTFIAYKDKVFGKPHTPAKAKQTLKELSGKSLSVVTGYTIIDTRTDRSISRAVISKVRIKKLSSREINAYVKTGEPLKRAGAFAIQELGSVFIDKIEGDFFSIMGLPVFKLVEELKTFGVDVVSGWSKKTSRHHKSNEARYI